MNAPRFYKHHALGCALLGLLIGYGQVDGARPEVYFTWGGRNYPLSAVTAARVCQSLRDLWTTNFIVTDQLGLPDWVLIVSNCSPMPSAILVTLERPGYITCGDEAWLDTNLFEIVATSCSREAFRITASNVLAGVPEAGRMVKGAIAVDLIRVSTSLERALRRGDVDPTVWFRSNSHRFVWVADKYYYTVPKGRPREKDNGAP